MLPTQIKLQNSYPWAEMKIGDSFKVVVGVASQLKAVQSRLASLGRKWAQRHPLEDNRFIQFITKRVPGGILVTRIA